MYAIYKGLLLPKDMSIDEPVRYSDSLHCVNLVKDFLAKLGASSDVDYLTHAYFQEGVREPLMNDAIGTFFLRE
ncbi:unnamed protein product [Trifolium pratense]|uniref:Uncharacterized protein n=2 Tax=Trifolium pratense TaxID=57577 RepID=A0ACB0LGU2_TRIPR|nr:unnamed protein product [Trifolium pratense]CAJ2674164.1 unnamed protein product [Trifolium pratense]